MPDYPLARTGKRPRPVDDSLRPLDELRSLRAAGFLNADQAHQRMLQWIDTWIDTLHEIRELPEATGAAL